MLADRTDEICGKFIAFIDVAAYLAYKAFLFGCFWFRFYIVLIVVVGHGFSGRDHTGFIDAADEHGVGSEVFHSLYR